MGRVAWPSPFSSDAALGLVRRLAADESRDPVTLAAVGEGGRVAHFVGTTARRVRQLTQTLESVPDLATLKSDGPQPVATTARLAVRGDFLPLRDRDASAASRQVLGALAAATFEGERLLLRVTIGPGVPARLLDPIAPDPTQTLASAALRGVRPARGETASRLRAKREDAGLRVRVTAGAEAGSEGRRRALLEGLLAALRTLESAGTRLGFVRDSEPGTVLPRRGRITLSVAETAFVAGWPLDAEDLPGMPPAHPRQLRLVGKDVELRRTFAETTAPGDPRPIGVSVTDALTHTHLLGPTGSGKSTAMLSLIASDLRAGLSVLVIDPKSDLVSDVLARVPSRRRDNVVVIDPTDERPVGLNPFHAPGVRPEMIADAVVSTLRDLFPSAFGPRTSDAVHSAAISLAGQPGATLAWLPRLFSDARLRRRVTESGDDADGVDSFWLNYDGLSEAAKAQMVGPVLSRLRQFLARPSLRRVLDQPEPRFWLGELFDKPRVVLVPLNAGVLGIEATKLLGALLVAQLRQLTFARAAVPSGQRRPVAVYIDEAQMYVGGSGDSLSESLAVSRGLGVAWHLAHQFRSQMPREVMAAIDANCLTKVVFRLDAEDARATASRAPALKPEDFMALPRFGVYADLIRGGERLGWVTGRTLPAPRAVSDADELRALSRERWGMTAEQPTSPGPALRANEEPQIGRRKRAEP